MFNSFVFLGCEGYHVNGMVKSSWGESFRDCFLKLTTIDISLKYEVFLRRVDSNLFFRTSLTQVLEVEKDFEKIIQP